MPIGARRRNTSAKIDQSSEATGWDAIQESMLSHDGEKFGDFADDIDTLLVFAGLFSAILTAFLVGSVANLKQDNTQLSAQLLALIALQNGAPQRIQNFLNSTAFVIPTSTTFQAADIDIVINALWFMSLVSSLAAALLGILAKQWCREYLKWHSAVAPARTNVLLRQIRYEMWQKWSVATFITSIPPLLELALILFFAGLACFTWTLQRIIAIVVTVFAGVTVALVFVLTLLPVFYRLCPFKTPTGWAFVRLAHLFYHPIRHEWAADPEKLADWRTRDLRITVDPNLCDDFTDYVGWTLDPGTQPRHPVAQLDALHVRFLTAALAWMQQGSTEERVSRAVTTCIEHLHDPRRRYTQSTKEPFFHSSVNTLAIISGWTTKHGFVSSYAQDFLYEYLNGNHPLNRAFGAVQLAFPSYDGWNSLIGPYYTSVLENVTEEDTVFLRTCRKVVYHDLRSLTDGYIYACGTEDMRNKTVMARRIAMVLGFLRCTPPGLANSLTMEEDLEEWSQVLCTMFHQLSSHKAAFCDGLISMVLELLCFMGEVTVDFGNHSVSLRKFSPYNDPRFVTSWADFSSQLFAASSNYTNEEIRHLFVISIIPLLGLISDRLESPSFCALNYFELNALDRLMACIVEATQISLENHYQDCGSYVVLQWLLWFSIVYQTAQRLEKSNENVVFTGHPGIRERFLLLLSLLKANIQAGLLSEGEAQLSILDDVLKFIGNPELPTPPHADGAGRTSSQGPMVTNAKPDESPSSSGNSLHQEDAQSTTHLLADASETSVQRIPTPLAIGRVRTMPRERALDHTLRAPDASSAESSSKTRMPRPLPPRPLSFPTPATLPVPRNLSDSPVALQLLNPFDRDTTADGGESHDMAPLLPAAAPSSQWVVERQPSLRSVTPRRSSWDPLRRRGTLGASLRSTIVPSGYVSAPYDRDADGIGDHDGGRWGNPASEGRGSGTDSAGGVGGHNIV